MPRATALAVALLTLAAPTPGGAQAPAAPAPVVAPSGPGAVTGAVTIVKDRADGKPRADRSGVVVYLEAPMDPELEDRLAEAPPPVHEVRQVNKTFVPAVSAVVRGTEVSFPNDDMIFHNVFSLSKTKRFDLGLYKSGTTKSVLLTRPGIIDVYCNIHPEMAAKILVLDNPYFAVTAADGSFTIAGVPPGTYPYVAWQARGEPVRGTVVVPAGGVARVDATLVETPQAHLHTRKDGSPYGRYN
jgi:plastocyanin